MDKGVMGLGALIVFIAIILVVGVAGIVLITSGGSLEQKALLKSRDARGDVSSGLEIISVIGRDASPTDSDGTPHKVDDLHIMVRLLPGTPSFALNSTLISIESSTSSQTIQFNSTCASECDAVTSNEYMVYYLKQGSYHENGYINIGDIAKLALKSSQEIGEDEEITIFIIPARGPQNIIRLQTPHNMVVSSVSLWPTTYG